MTLVPEVLWVQATGNSVGPFAVGARLKCFSIWIDHGSSLDLGGSRSVDVFFNELPYRSDHCKQGSNAAAESLRNSI